MRPGESFVGQPIRSLQTMLRVISEQDRSIPTVVPDGIYGKETVAAITDFQRNNGLPITGITDQTTWELVSDRYEDALIYVGKAEPIEVILDANEVLRRGRRSPYIYLAQSMLLFLSSQYSAIPAPTHSGTLDEETASAIKGFQIINGLKPTGDIDRKTWKHLSKQFTLAANRVHEN